MVVLLGLYWVGYDTVDQRVVTLRMFLFFVSGLIAFAIPFLLFPDRFSASLQLGNVTGRRLIYHLVRRSSSLLWIALLLIILISFGDLQTPLANLETKTTYAAVGLFTCLGLYFLAVSRYTRSGMDSQFWKESDRGKELRRQFADYMKYPIDPGAVPSLINTLLITTLGMVAVSIGAVLNNIAGGSLELIPAVIVLLIGARSLRAALPQIDRHYYATNAFFGEFFGVTIKADESRESIKVKQLWWVPKPLKSHVWALLLQLDRKFPAGRVILLGHLLVWFISYQRPGADVMLSVWMLFAIAHHAVIVISFSPEYAPLWWQRWSGSSTAWSLSRFWMQFRWILILTFSFWINSLIFGYASSAELGSLLFVYTVSGLMVSVAGQIYQTKKAFK